LFFFKKSVVPEMKGSN